MLLGVKQFLIQPIDQDLLVVNLVGGRPTANAVSPSYDGDKFTFSTSAAHGILHTVRLFDRHAIVARTVDQQVGWHFRMNMRYNRSIGKEWFVFIGNLVKAQKCGHATGNTTSFRPRYRVAVHRAGVFGNPQQKIVLAIERDYRSNLVLGSIFGASVVGQRSRSWGQKTRFLGQK